MSQFFGIQVPIEDVASPAELAKAFMGSRPSKVSSSIVPRATKHAAVHENGFVTLRSHGRSAIYKMARTPYARIYPTSTLKGGRLAVQGEPSSSTRSALDHHDMLSGPNKGTLNRRNSALDNDVGSFSPICRISHKSNLLYSKVSSLPLSGSSLSVARSGVGIDAAQQPSSSMQKPILLDEVKHSHTKSSIPRVSLNNQMATEEKENPYVTAGLGTGGKFRKCPFRRTQTTSYDRPPTSLKNPNRNNGWLSKLVDAAHRLITYSAHSLFSLLGKRLPPPSSEREQEARLNHHVEATFVPIEDVVSPAELAKAYIWSRHSKVSSSIVPRATRHAVVNENGFLTPRSHGRSAIYKMVRTPYARIYPTSTLKGGGLAVQGEPSSSTRSALDHHDMLSGPNKGTLKRRSSVLDNDIGSFGRIRRIRHKPNLLYSKVSSLPLSGSSLSVARSGVGIDAAQQPSSSMQKPILLDEVKHSHMKLSEANVDNTIPSMSYSPLPSKSSEMASKIHQLDKLVSPKEKSSESRLPIVNDNSPTKLSPSMLRGQALRSMEIVDSSKLLDNVQGDKLNGTFGNLSASAQNQKLTSHRDMVENGPLKLVAPSDGLVPVKIATDATKQRNQVLSSAKSVDSFMIKSISYPPQKNKAFNLSAHEDCLDLDDDAHPDGAFSSSSPVEKEITRSTAMAEKTTSGMESIAQENSSSLSPVMPSKSFSKDGEAHVGTDDGSRAVEKVDVSTSKASFIHDPTFKPAAVTKAIQTSFGSNKPVSSNGSITTAAPSKETTKSSSIFGMEKIVSSEECGPDAPLVNFGTNGNVSKVPPIPFTASSSVGGESTFLKFGASSESKLGSSISSTTAAGATDSVTKVRESDINDTETNTDTAFSVRASKLPVPSLVSNNFTNQNMFSNSCLAASCGTSATAASTGTRMTAITPAIIESNNSSSSPSFVASSSSSPFSTTSFSKFGSSDVPSTGLPESSSASEPLETKSRLDARTGNLSSTAFGSSSDFGSSSSTMTTVNSQSQCSINGARSGYVLGAQASPATSGFATSIQTQSVPFGSSASLPSFGLTWNTSLSSRSSLIPSSGPTTITSFSSGSSIFSSSSSSAKNIFNSGSIFGLGSIATSSAVNSVSSNSGINSSLFGPSSWQPSKSSFGSSFSSLSSSGFSFGAFTSSVASTSSPKIFSSASCAITPQLSFISAAATTSTHLAFGSPNSVLPFGSAAVNDDQMSMEDSMAEDLVQATPPANPIFGKQPAPVQSNSVFGASTPSGASPFRCGISSWQPNKSSFGSPFSSPSSSGFSFGAFTSSVASTSSPKMFSLASSASTPQFSFNSAASTTSTQLAFGSPNSVLPFGSAAVYNDQMSMEDSMAEDLVQATLLL